MKRIWPLNDELGVPPYEVFLGEYEERGGPGGPVQVLAPPFHHLLAQLRPVDIVVASPDAAPLTRFGRLGLKSPEPVK